MSGWNDLFEEVNKAQYDFASIRDTIRRRCISELSDLTERNVIIYYSGWLNKPEFVFNSMINDEDKNGFMATIKGLDKKKGLDLILHTQGGENAATESLVDYLTNCFDDIRAIIPQIAMSAGTMIACSCKSIMMGKQSSLGPIDPQINGIAAHGIVEEFNNAVEQIRTDQFQIPLWQSIMSKYSPALIGECKKAITWSEEMVTSWLKNGMLKEKPDDYIHNVVKELSDHAITKFHARHLSAKKCSEIGLKIEMMETDQKLQDAILSVHHATMITLSQTPALKIIENQNGQAFIKNAGIVPQNQ